MFKLYISFLLFLFSVTVPAQWRLMSPHPSGNLSHMGSAPSVNKYAVVTQQAQVIMTTDAGANWTIKNLPTTSVLRACFFINDNVGWVGGAGSALFKTTDGGENWTFVPAIDTIKYDLYFLNENTGWGTGFRGFVMKTTDGGSNWISQSVTHLSTSTMYGVFATDNNNVFVSGDGNSFFRSTDGGSSWNTITSPFGTTTSFREVKFTSSTNGFVIGNYARIAKTTDGGATWSISNNSATNTQLWSINFNSAGTIGVAAGASGLVLRTTDSGATWTPVAGFPSVTFYSLRFATDNVVYLSGSSGYYFKSTDAGATWTELSYHFTSTTLNDVSFADSLIGYVVGNTGLIGKSTNGGYTWTQQSSSYTGEINEIIATSPNFAVAGCDAGTVLRTTNGGTSWEQIATGISGTSSDILAIDFINDTLGFLAAYNGITAKSTDGGLTWIIQGSVPAGNPWDMDMVDENFGWIAATGERIIRTTDGGLTWEQQYYGGGLGTYGISFIDRATGVAGGTGGNTFYTTNGGNNWNPAVTKPAQTVWGIHIMPSPVYGTVALTACASGYVYKSTDGGANWVLEPRQTISTFEDISMFDAAHAWFVGSSGTILAYNEPGNIPVELSSLSALVNGRDVLLKWSTATETNNRGFEIERTSVSRTEEAGSDSWEKIGFVSGNGTTTEMVSYTFTDKDLAAGFYIYRIRQIDMDGSYRYYDLNETIEIKSPAAFELGQNYPNPFNPATKISFSIPSDGFVTLKVFNSLGEEAALLINNQLKAGFYEKEFNASDLPSGIYYYTLTAGNLSVTKKMVLIK